MQGVVGGPIPQTATRQSWLRSLDTLAYVPEPGRDLRLDFLRGFVLFAIIVDHLAGPSKLHLLPGGNRFFTSAAEGFVVISGLVVGLVYRQIAEREGLPVALRRLIERAWLLYVLAMGLTLVMLPLSELLKLPWAEGFNHPDLFHGVGAHSASLHVDDRTFPPVGTGADFDAREPLSLAQLAGGIEDLDIAIDTGDQDPWIERVEALHQILADRHIRHSYAIPLGGHDGGYWQRNLVSYLQFYDAVLH